VREATRVISSSSTTAISYARVVPIPVLVATDKSEQWTDGFPRVTSRDNEERNGRADDCSCVTFVSTEGTRRTMMANTDPSARYPNIRETTGNISVGHYGNYERRLSYEIGFLNVSVPVYSRRVPRTERSSRIRYYGTCVKPTCRKPSPSEQSLNRSAPRQVRTCSFANSNKTQKPLAFY